MDDFSVIQMNWLQKLLYRSLLQQIFVCETTPYVPNNDNILWRLAGAENLEMWVKEKPLIMEKFEIFDDEEGRPMLKHKRLERDYCEIKKLQATTSEKRSEAGRRGAAAKWAKNGTDGNDMANGWQNLPKDKSKTKNEKQQAAVAVGRAAFEEVEEV